MAETLTTTAEDDRLRVTLDDPATGNALSRDTILGLRDTLEGLDAEDYRCVVVEGAGEPFSTGGNLEDVSEARDPAESVTDRIETHAKPLTEAVTALYTCPVPTVAKVDGAAFGGGATLAIACDIVLGSPAARISFGFRQVGVSIDVGTSFLLSRQVGESVGTDLVLTGELVDAERAYDLGLLTRLFDDGEFEERSREIIERVATGPTVALRRSKRLLKEAPGRTIEEATAAELAAVEDVMETADYREGVRAFLEEREPAFEGR